MTPFPTVFNTQIAEKSILDAFNKQTYLGNGFILPQNGKSLADTTETVIQYIVNPSTNTKSLFLDQRKLSSTNNPITVRFYLNPTASATGTATLPINLRTGYTTASTASCYLAPTITGNGTFVVGIPASTAGTQSSLMIVLDPGTSMVITGQQIGAGTSSLFVQTSWYEI